MPTIATPNILVDPGYLFRAPLGTALPTNTVSGGEVFTDAWAVDWVPLGATEEGSTFNYASTVEAITVAELFDPVQYATTSREGSMAFNLADWTLENLKRALNGGTLTVTGVAPDEVTSYEPPDPGNEVRSMIGWESQDNTVRIIVRQAINGGEIASAFQKAPEKAVIACQFQMEKPASAQPFIVFSASDARTGT